MEKITLNETPVRTSKSFGINNIQFEEFIVPQIQEFTNVQIKSEIEVLNQKDYFDLKYEIEKNLTTQILEKANQSLLINIPEGKEVTNPIVIDFTLTGKQSTLVDNIFIKANNNSKVEVIIKYKCEKENDKCYHNGICRVLADKGADVKITIVNLLNSNTSNYYIMNSVLKDNANVEYVVVDFGGERTITNYYSNLEGKEANSKINTMYLGKNNQLIDINYIGELYGEKSNIDMEIYGALQGNSKKNFKGTIDFKTGCKKSKGSENEYCMLLSKEAKSKALPMLLCREDDVQGSHSNSAGKIDEDKLYYIMTRGIPYEEARKLIVKANFNNIILKLNDENLQEEIIKEIDRRLV